MSPKCSWKVSLVHAIQKSGNHWFRLPTMKRFFDVKVPIPILQISQLRDLNSEQVGSKTKIRITSLGIQHTKPPVPCPAAPNGKRHWRKKLCWPNYVTSFYYAVFISCFILNSGTKRTAKFPMGNDDDWVPYFIIVNPVDVEAGNEVLN